MHKQVKILRPKLKWAWRARPGVCAAPRHVDVVHAHANKHAMRARTSGSSPSSTTPQDDATEREAMAARFDEIIRSSNEVATPPSAGQFLVLGGVGMDRFLLNKASGGHAADASGAVNTAFRVAATDAVAVFRERFGDFRGGVTGFRNHAGLPEQAR